MIMSRLSIFILPAICISLGGCAASKIVTAPVKVAGSVVGTAVDATTTTQSEREQDVGKKALKRRKEERKACLKDARSKADKKYCKAQYEREF